MKITYSRIALLMLVPASLVFFQTRTTQLVAQSVAQSEILSKIRESIHRNNWQDAQKLIQKNPRDQFPKEELHIYDFSAALAELNLGKIEKANSLFEKYTKEHTKLLDFANFYFAKTKNFRGPADATTEEEEKIYERLLRESSNLKLKTEILKELGHIALKKKNFIVANRHFSEILRRMRLTEDSPEIHYALAQTERGLKNTRKFCTQIMKIYSEFPQLDKIKDWGPSLSENLFEGTATGCKADFDDFRRRVRFFMWAGLDQRAFDEIQTAKKINLYVPVEIDQALAYYYVQSGEVAKSLEVLKKYENELGNQLGYILNYAGILARAGELEKSIQFYHKAHQLAPRDSRGRQALYQAAFLSYQNRNYDEAEKRFNEFIKKNPRSGLSQDAKWHLAWIKYLKKDYKQAINDFKKLDTISVRAKGKKRVQRFVVKQDRVKYWLAMSHLKLNEFDQARPIFESLAQSNLFGYYAISAGSRLKYLDKLVAESAQRKIAQQSSRAQRFGIREQLLASMDSNEVIYVNYENEDQLKFEADMDFKSKDSDETPIIVQEENEAEVDAIEAEDADVKIKDPKILAKMDSARDLMKLGLNEWAKWDLYEIERSTKNREYLKVLVADYSAIGQFHRSSYLAQTYFGKLRQDLGMEAGRGFWEQAFPKAYEEHVIDYSKKNAVSQEFIWSIMKAESHFRVDAISPVGALGLMQVMPFTGIKVSALLKEKKFEPSDLLQAESAIKYGSRYLRRLADKFGGHTPLVAAAYNAGPHRVKTWAYSFGDLDMDEFIEHIPFLETRNYVKRVLSYQFIYAKLYRGQSDFTKQMTAVVPYKVDGKPPFAESWDDI